MEELTDFRKNERKLVVIGALIGAVLVSAFVGLGYWFFSTMPSIEQDLKYSPFKNEGTWQCHELDFSITSTKEYYDDDPEFWHYVQVSTMTVDEQQYNITFGYVATRGFDHRFAVSLRFRDDDCVYQITRCKYKFEEDGFVLYDFSYKSGSKTLPVTKLTFDKIN